jgi:hypothetical protein
MELDAAIGGRMNPVGRTRFGRAVAAAMNSPLTMGPARFHHAGAREEVDTVYLGAFSGKASRRSAASATFPSGSSEDADFYYRWRRSGRRVFVDPAIVTATPPGSPGIAVAAVLPVRARQGRDAVGERAVPVTASAGSGRPRRRAHVGSRARLGHGPLVASRGRRWGHGWRCWRGSECAAGTCADGHAGRRDHAPRLWPGHGVGPGQGTRPGPSSPAPLTGPWGVWYHPFTLRDSSRIGIHIAASTASSG